MKKSVLKFMATAFVSSLLMTSCYSYTSVVGNGAQGNSSVTKANHYLIGGLVSVGASDSKAMAGGAKDYTVHTRQTFLDGLLMVITGGIYTPTTTTVTK